MVLERALQDDPTQINLRRALIRLWIDAGRFEEAKAQLESIRQTNPGDADLPFLMGQCEEGLTNYEPAAAYYAQACELQPDRVEVFLRRSQLLRDKLRATERADGVIRAMVEHNPQSSDAQLAAARYYTQSNRWNEADSRLQIVLTLQPEPEATVYLWAADVAIARGEHHNALGRLRNGLQNHPENTSLRLTLARLALQLGYRNDALECLQPLTESFPSQPDDLVRLCGLLIDLDQFEKAAAAIDRLRGNAASAIIAFLQAHFLVKQEAWGQARVLLTEAIPALAVPEWRLQANLLLGQCQERLGNSDGAWSAYGNALQVNRRNVPALLGRAAAFVRMRRLDEAISGYRLAVQDNIELSLPLARLLILRNLQLAAMAREWTEVDRLFDGLPKHLQNSTDAIVARAELLSAKGQHTEAATVLDAARQNHADKLELWIASAELAASHGRADDASRLLGDACARFTDRIEPVLTRVRLATRQPLEVARQELESLESESARFGPAEQNRLLAALGDGYLQLGDMAAAVKIWKHLATRAPKDLGVRVQLFGAASQSADESEMQRLLDEIRHLEGQGGSFGAYGEAALLVVRAQRGEITLLAHAKARADLAAAQRPNWSAAALLQAQIADLQGNVDTALERYQRAVDLGERQPNVVRRVVDLLYRRQRYAEAQVVLQKLPAPAVLESGLGRHAVALTLLTTLDNDTSRRRAYDLARQSLPTDSKDYRDFLWLGQVAVAAGLHTEAEAMFRRAAELDLESPDPWMALIAMMIQTDRMRAAEVISEAKGKLPPVKAGLALAPAFEMLGQPEEAQRHYEAVLALKPDDPETLGSVAGFHVRTGHWPKAEECLRKMMQLRPATNEFGHAWARRHLAIVLAASGTYAKYREALTLLSENQPATLDDELALGVVQATQPDQRDQAIALLEKVHQQRPLRWREMLVLARLHDAGGNREKAMACLVQLVQSDPSDPIPLAYLVELLTKHGFQQSARDWLTKLEKMNADPFVVMSLRARWLQKGGQGDEAIRVVTTFANENTASLPQAAALLEDIGRPADAEPLYRAFAERSKPVGVLLLSRFLGRQHCVDEALSLCEPLWVSVPAEAVADTCLAVFRSAPATDVQFQKVETWLAAAIRNQPQSVLLIALRAELHFHARQYAESIAGYREVLTRDPNNVVALNLLAWMLAVKDGQGAEALGLVQRAIGLIGPRADLLDTRAMVYLALGRTKEAIQDSRDVARLNPSATAYFHLALAYHKTNDRAKTEEAFRKAQEIGISPLAVHPLERRSFDHLVGALNE